MSKISSNENNLECPICNNKYDFDEHRPKLLTCNNKHIICLKCVKSLTCKEDPKCPFDRLNISSDTNNYQNCSMDELVSSVFAQKESKIGSANANDVMRELTNELGKLGYDKNSDQWIESFMQDFSNKGKTAIDKHESSFGMRDSVRIRKAIHSNELLNSFKGVSTKLTNEEVKSELREVLDELGYDESRDGEDWLGDFIQNFSSKGISSIDDFESKFGARDTVKLRNKLQTNAKIMSFVKLIKQKPQAPKNVSRRDALNELETILQELDLDSESWVDDFTQDFTTKGVAAIDDFESKLGVRDASRLKTKVDKNEVLKAFLRKIKNFRSEGPMTKDEASSELEKLLSREDYDAYDNPWVSSFIKKFTSHGINGIDEFKSKFGDRHYKTIKNAITNNSRLLTFSNSIQSESESNLDQEKVTPKRAMTEMENILKKMGYEAKSTIWLADLLADVIKNGFPCLNNYTSFLGEKDFKELKKQAFCNQILLTYNHDLNADNQNTSDTQTVLDKPPVLPPRPPVNSYINDNANKADDTFLKFITPLSMPSSIFPNLKKPEKDLFAVVLG